MLIRTIDPYRCNGCGACEVSCMGDVIRMSDAKVIKGNKGIKATITYPEDCTGCMTCELACPRQAIDVN